MNRALIILIAGLCIGCKSEPPPGYMILRDANGKYCWRDDDGFTDTFRYGSKRSAIFRAWCFYKYEGDTKNRLELEIVIDNSKKESGQ